MVSFTDEQDSRCMCATQATQRRPNDFLDRISALQATQGRAFSSDARGIPLCETALGWKYPKVGASSETYRPWFFPFCCYQVWSICSTQPLLWTSDGYSRHGLRWDSRWSDTWVVGIGNHMLPAVSLAMMSSTIGSHSVYLSRLLSNCHQPLYKRLAFSILWCSAVLSCNVTNLL